MAWQRTRIDIPDWLTPAQRQDLADDILEFIKRRTEDGLSVDGDKFPGYSESYIKSLDFKIGGKSAGEVNLTLSGDMLAAMQLLSHKSGSLLIGYEKGTPENDRAEGNNLGSYGGDPNPKKARRFLGISPEDLASILDHYDPPTEDDKKGDDD